jgi:predicted metal-dependent hydrolase
VFDGHSDESPSVLGKPNSDCMICRRNQHTAKKKLSVAKCFSRANGCREQMEVAQEAEPITEDQVKLQDFRLSNVMYACLSSERLIY